MKSENLYDSCIRLALCEMLHSQEEGASDSVIIEELGLCRGKTRVDVALVNGIMHGFEIKSDHDSLTRLPQQCEMYSRIFDKTTLVVGNRHYSKALSLIPEWWGVLRVEQTDVGPIFVRERDERRNPGRESRAIVELLWLDEAIGALEECNAARGIRSKPRKIVWDRVCEVLSIDEISAIVRERLKVRKGGLRLQPSL